MGDLAVAESDSKGQKATEPEQRSGSRRLWLRRIGTTFAVVGLLLLAWGALIYFWQEPFTGLYAGWKQRGLATEYRDRARAFQAEIPETGAAAAATAEPGTEQPVLRDSGGPAPSVFDFLRSEDGSLDFERLASIAEAYRLSLEQGEPMGRIIIPRLGVEKVVVNGASGGDVRNGPGRDLRTLMPGEGGLVYIAGHRTTYGAPFRHIDDLEPGDPIVVEVPYGRFLYHVTETEAVFPHQVEKLESRGHEELSIQASHPPYSARQRLIVHARFLGVLPPAE